MAVRWRENSGGFLDGEAHKSQPLARYCLRSSPKPVFSAGKTGISELQTPLPGTCSLTPKSDAPRPGSTLLRRWLPLILIGVAIVAIFASGIHRYLTLESITMNKGRLEALVDANLVLALLLYLLVYIAIIALSIPGSLLMTITGGLLFPLWIAIPSVVVSATAGATLIFLIARSSLGEALRARSSEGVKRMTEGLKEDAASYMLFLRLVPLFPFALVNLAPAIVGVPLKTFIWTTFVGVMPASTAFSLAANSLDGLLDERKAAFSACLASGKTDCALAIDLSALVSPKLLMAFAALGVVALVPVLAKRFFMKKKGAASG
jgi:uncharacterized membrane protein YdjX (TVP38/TMEM64 family)